MEALLSPSGASSPSSKESISVTVVMPIRNEEGFIVRSLEAVLNQNYPPGLLEVIVADGRSEDRTLRILRDLAQRHPNLRVIDNPARVVPVGLNRAIREARGDIIVRVDGHTLVAPDYVSECVATLHRTGADNVGGPMRARGESPFGCAVAAATGSPFGVGGARFHYSENEEWVDTVYMGAWKRELFDRIGPFDEEMVRDQDDEFNYRLLDRGGRVLLSPHIRSSYSVRGSPRLLWRQYFQYGYWKVRVIQKHPRQARLRHLVPPVFAAALFLSFVVAGIVPGAVLVWLPVPASYMVANLVASIASARRAGWALLGRLVVVYAILHLSYGFGLLAGLARFAGKWGAPAAPSSSVATGRDTSA